MKLKIMLAAIFLAGLAASVAIAQPPPGHGNPHVGQGNAPAVTTTGTTGTTGTTTTTTTMTTRHGHSDEHGRSDEHGHSGRKDDDTGDDDSNKDDHDGSGHAGPGKVLVCHKTGHGWVLVSVSANSALARGKHRGDKPAVGGTCPTRPNGRPSGTTTGTTTTIATTTTGTTTATTTTTTTG